MIMIEWLGLLYGAGKDLVDYLTWNEEDKEVDISWLDKSGFNEQSEKENIELVWLKAIKLESKILDGYEVFYELDKNKRVRRRIIIKDSNGNVDLVLVKKP